MLDRLEALVRNVGVIAACILIPAQILVGVSYLTGRKVSQFSITPLQELEWHFFFILVFLTLGAALLAERRVRIDIVRIAIPPPQARSPGGGPANASPATAAPVRAPVADRTH